MTSYYYYYFISSEQGKVEIVYYLTGDILITTNLTTKKVTINFNNTPLPKDIKAISYDKYISLLINYDCIT